MDGSEALNRRWVFDMGFSSRWVPAERQKKYVFGWQINGGGRGIVLASTTR
jgi:hypothetical protein